jgi:DNA mismatch endonuclease (patch repair protein)
MSRIRSRDTKPELTVRSLLHRMGYRFRVHVKELPGHPDVVLPKFKTVLLINGCFWHQHADCEFAYMPKSRKSFWTKKLRGNVERDAIKSEALRTLGWRVETVWECELGDLETLSRRLALLRYADAKARADGLNVSIPRPNPTKARPCELQSGSFSRGTVHQ